MADDSAYADDGESNINAHAIYYPFALVIVSVVSFWVQSVVTEERLVPALNVISEYFKIPDDIAGATLMAAGASSPELLCTIISLFVTHSSLGLGTIVGSEIFNQLIICAGSVYSSKAHSNDENVSKYGERFLVLDKTMVIREVGFYALSIGLLYVALSEVVWDKYDEIERINVSLWKACLLFGGYVLYVLVCVYMEQITRFIGFVLAWEDEPSKNEREIEVVPQEVTISASWYNIYGHSNDTSLRSLESAMSMDCVHCKNFHEEDLHQLPFIYNLTSEPAENLEATGAATIQGNASRDSSFGKDDDAIIITQSTDSSDEVGNKKKGIRGFLTKSFKLLLLPKCGANYGANYPVQVNDVLELTNDDNTCEMRCHLWERSYFYSKARARRHAFHLRWFTITPQRISSVPDRNAPTKHVIVYPLFDEIHVDVKRLIIQLVNPVKGKRNFVLIAPSRAIFDAVLLAFDKYVTATSSLRDMGVTELDDERGDLHKLSKRDKNADPHIELIECPKNASLLGIFLFGMLFPLRLIMHYTLPDVRHLDHHGIPTASIWVAYVSTITSLIWLLAGSYVMVVSLETLADVIGIPDAVMGVSSVGLCLCTYFLI
jgi:Ca2+/Na+ antiporter